MVNDASRIVKAQSEGGTTSEHQAVIAGWASAEDTLYGPLLADPQGYERVVALVGVLVAHLRAEVHDLDALVAASQRGVQLVAEVAPDAALPWLPLEAVLRAACAMRHRELVSVKNRAERTKELAEAAAAGATWVRLVDPGSLAAAHVAPALLVHLASGMAIRCTTEMDEETGGALFVTQPVMADLATGDVSGPLSGAGEDRVATSVGAREADVRELQELIERLDSENRVG